MTGETRAERNSTLAAALDDHHHSFKAGRPSFNDTAGELTETLLTTGHCYTAGAVWTYYTPAAPHTTPYRYRHARQPSRNKGEKSRAWWSNTSQRRQRRGRAGGDPLPRSLTASPTRPCPGGPKSICPFNHRAPLLATPISLHQSKLSTNLLLYLPYHSQFSSTAEPKLLKAPSS